MSLEDVQDKHKALYGKTRKPRFAQRLDSCVTQEYASEASLSERGKMMTFHFTLMSTVFIFAFIMFQWFLGQYLAMNMAAPLTAEQSQTRMMVVNVVSLVMAGMSVLSLTFISRTPIGYLVFNARVVDAKSLSSISISQAGLRCIVKTLAILVTPLALFYLIRRGDSNMVDALTGTRIVLYRKVLIEQEEAGEEEASVDSEAISGPELDEHSRKAQEQLKSLSAKEED